MNNLDIRHPARYTDSLLPIMAEMLSGHNITSILDPFGGTGKIFRLSKWLPDARIEAVEIEPEWAAFDERTTLGNALSLPFGDGEFDAIVASLCHGNHVIDHYGALDSSKRYAYIHDLGRKLHPVNAGAMQWGTEYRTLHRLAWIEVRRTLEANGIFLLNVKDHIRSGKRVPVTSWHIKELETLGFSVIERREVECHGSWFGQNGNARIDTESLILFRRET